MHVDLLRIGVCICIICTSPDTPRWHTASRRRSPRGSTWTLPPATSPRTTAGTARTQRSWRPPAYIRHSPAAAALPPPWQPRRRRMVPAWANHPSHLNPRSVHIGHLHRFRLREGRPIGPHLDQISWKKKEKKMAPRLEASRPRSRPIESRPTQSRSSRSSRSARRRSTLRSCRRSENQS